MWRSITGDGRHGFTPRNNEGTQRHGLERHSSPKIDFGGCATFERVSLKKGRLIRLFQMIDFDHAGALRLALASDHHGVKAGREIARHQR